MYQIVLQVLSVSIITQSMEELVQQGKVQSIGVSNFSITKLEKLLKTAKIIPAVNQGKYTDQYYDLYYSIISIIYWIYYSWMPRVLSAAKTQSILEIER